MRLKDLMGVASYNTGLKIGQEALIYYNEAIDYLLSLYPDKITKPYIETVDIGSNRKFTIPGTWASVLKIKNSHGLRVYCEIIDDVLVFPYSGTFEVRYTKKPCVTKNLEDELEHNRIFDSCIPYYLAWKMSERDQLSQNRVQKYYNLFLEYLGIAVKSKAKQRLKYIKSRPLL